MSTQSYNGVLQGDGTQINLGTSDDLLLGSQGFIQNTEQNNSAAPTIIGNGSSQHATILGQVFGYFEALRLGDYVTGHDQYVKIGASGRLFSDQGGALTVYGNHSKVLNNGIIDGGVHMHGVDKATHSMLQNNGTITASGNAISLAGNEQFTMVNTGIITSTVADNAFTAAGSHKAIEIRNSGQMVGSIVFGTGDDVYDGRHGTIKGGVYGQRGNDMLTGGDGKDLFNGGLGRDILTGGRGADTFSYSALSDSSRNEARRDLITDFSHAQRDTLDLRTIDAISANDGGRNDAFTFIGQKEFTGEAGELHFGFRGGNTFVSADVDGDRIIDFAIELQGHVNLVKSDFHL